MPDGRLPVSRIAVSGLDRRNPARGAQRAARSRGGRRARGLLRRRRRRRRAWAAAATWPARSGLRRAAADAAGAHRGRLHLGIVEPAARALRATRVPGLPARRARGRRATWSPAGRCRRSPARSTAPRRAPASASPRTTSACWCSAARSARARSTMAALDAFGEAAPCAVLHACRPPRLPRAAARLDGARLARALPARAPTSTPSPTRSRPPTWRPPARAARCSSWPPRACPSILVPYPHATADHQTRNARWMAEGGAAVVVPDAELDGAAAGARGGRAARVAAAPGGDAQRGARARAARTPPQRIADEVMAAAG